MNKYQNGKIYKIVCRVTNLVYIGSTIEKYLSNRLKNHRSNLKTNKINTTSSKVLEGGDYYIELVELYPCNSKDELLVRERYYFDIIDCVNKHRPKRTEEEKKKQSKKCCQEYYEKNKDKIKKQKQINLDKIKENKKVWYQLNKDKIKKQYKLKKLKEQQNQSSLALTI
jgi:hypothetical protein